MSARVSDLFGRGADELRYEPIERRVRGRSAPSRRRQHERAPRLGTATGRAVLRGARQDIHAALHAVAADATTRRRHAAPRDPVQRPHRRGRAGRGRRPRRRRLPARGPTSPGYVVLDFTAFDAWYEEDEPVEATRATRSTASTSAGPRGRCGSRSTARSSRRRRTPGCCSRPASRPASTCRARTSAPSCAPASAARTAPTRARRPTGPSTADEDIALELRAAAAGRAADHGPRRVLGRARRRVPRRRAARASHGHLRGGPARRVRRLPPGVEFGVALRERRGGLVGRPRLSSMSSGSTPSSSGQCHASQLNARRSVASSARSARLISGTSGLMWKRSRSACSRWSSASLNAAPSGLRCLSGCGMSPEVGLGGVVHQRREDVLDVAAALLDELGHDHRVLRDRVEGPGVAAEPALVAERAGDVAGVELLRIGVERVHPASGYGLHVGARGGRRAIHRLNDRSFV